MAKGNKTGGRTKGTPNKATQYTIDRLEELDFDPLDAMVRIAKQAEKEGELSVAAQLCKEMASYIYPKRKAIDVELSSNNEDVLTDITIHFVGSGNEGKEIMEC